MNVIFVISKLRQRMHFVYTSVHIIPFHNKVLDRYLLSYSRSLNEFDNGGIDLMNYNMIKP